MEQDYYDRSKSYGPGAMHNHTPTEITSHHATPAAVAGPSHDLRCYSASFAQSQMCNFNNTNNNFNYYWKDYELKKGKSTCGSSSSKGWSTADPEFQRKKRVAGYKMYSVEGKVKGSFRKSIRWLKDRYTRMLYGW